MELLIFNRKRSLSRNKENEIYDAERIRSTHVSP